MAPRLREWNAYAALNITSRDSNGMTCVGNTIYGKRCRWDIQESSYRKVRAMLNSMEERPPRKAVKLLGKLARLSLCHENHQNQAENVVEKWSKAIVEAEADYEKATGLIHLLQKNLDKEGAKIERLEAKLENEKTNLDLVKRQLETALEAQEEQEKIADRYRRQFVKSTRHCKSLEEDKSKLSDELAIQKAGLETAIKQSQDNSTEYRRILSQKDRNIEETSAELKNLHEELTSSDSRLHELGEQLVQIRQELEIAKTERTSLSAQIEDLTGKLNLESKKSAKYESDLIATRSDRDSLLNEIELLRSQLATELQRSSGLVQDLERAEATHTKLSNEKLVFRSELEAQRQSYEDLTAELNQLKTEHAILSGETDTLRNQLASERKTSAGIRQELRTAEDDLSTSSLGLEQALRGLQDIQERFDEFKASAAEKETENFALVAELTNQLEFFHNHLLKAVFMSLFNTFKRWNKAVFELARNVIPSKRILGRDDSEANPSV